MRNSNHRPAGFAVVPFAVLALWGACGATRALAQIPLDEVGSIAASSSNTCAVTTSGHVQCWGSAQALGDGADAAQRLPVTVAGLEGVGMAVGGANHLCALTAGAVRCWGENGIGQLGDGGVAARSAIPIEVEIGGTVVSITSRVYHTCAVTADGAATCWGYNRFGQVGDGEPADRRTTPAAVIALPSGVDALAAGYDHTCARTSTGVVCWGSNELGQLGDGAAADRLTPAAVQGLSGDIVAIAAGSSHTCAIASPGSVQCWGYNNRGQLGDGTTTSRRTAIAVAGIADAVAIVAGYAHSCALTAAGAVLCWGDNDSGQLGDGTFDGRPSATPVAGLGAGVVAIAAGTHHTCAVVAEGRAKCWGHGAALGDGTAGVDRPVPVDVLQAVPPAAPAIGSVTAVDGAVFVAFAPPPSDGGRAITGFVATSVPDGIVSVGCTASPCTVTGLTNGVAYTFTVAAINGVGTGMPSSPSGPVTPRAPVATDDVFVKAGRLTIAGDVLANDHDPGNGTVSVDVLMPPVHGTVALEPDGRFVYTPEPLYAGTDGFSYRLSYTAGAPSTADVDLMVDVANAVRLPIASGVAISGISALHSGETVLTTNASQVFRRHPDLAPKHMVTIGNAAIRSAALLPDGTAYLAGSDTMLYAFAASGAGVDRWPRSIGSAVAHPMAVDATGAVYVCPANGVVQTISRQNSLLGATALDAACAAAPLLMPVVDRAVVTSISGAGAVVSLAQFSGGELQVERELLWPSPTATPLSAISASRFAWVDRSRYVNVADAVDAGLHLQSVDPLDFDPIGELLTTDDGGLVIAGETASATGRLCRYTPALEPQWCVNFDAPPASSGALGNAGVAYFGLADGSVVVVDLADGGVFTTFQATSPLEAVGASAIASDLLFDGSRIMVGDSTGVLAWIPVDAIGAAHASTADVPVPYWSAAQGGRMRNGRAHAVQPDVGMFFSAGFETP